MPKKFGEMFKDLRRARTDMSLRQFCDEHGFDAGYLSKMERGRIPPPPSSEKLNEYLTALGVETYSTEWFDLLDAAAAARRELPHYMPDDEEVLDLLPLLFREMRGGDEAVTRDRLQRLIQFLREA